MAKFDLRPYAEAGARARLVELLAEADIIRRAFPGIDSTTPAKAPSRQSAAAAGGRRSTMTDAERNAVSARMKVQLGDAATG